MNYFSSLIEALLGMGAPAGDGMGGGFGNFIQPAGNPGRSEQEYIDAYDLRNALLKHGHSQAPTITRAVPINQGDVFPVPQARPNEWGDERDWLPGGTNYRPAPRAIIPAPLYRPAPRQPVFIDA